MRKIQIRNPKPAEPPKQAAPEGFAAGLRALVDRKLQELKGRRWFDTTGKEKPKEAAKRARERQKEALKRAVAEMGKRIEQQTGKRPADSTIRKHAAKNTTPKGIDYARLNRQAAIDRAGGFKPFATQMQVSEGVARRWRDRGGDLGRGTGPGSMTITIDVYGNLRGRSKKKPGKISEVKRRMQVSITFTATSAQIFRAALANNDIDVMSEMIGPQVALEYLPEDTTYTVTSITHIEVE